MSLKGRPLEALKEATLTLVRLARLMNKIFIIETTWRQRSPMPIVKGQNDLHQFFAIPNHDEFGIVRSSLRAKDGENRIQQNLGSNIGSFALSSQRKTQRGALGART